MERLQSVEGLVLPCWQENVTPNYAYFPVLFDQDVLGIDRDEIYDRLKMRNIYARKYFYPLINDADCYKAVYSSKATPIARKISDSILTLPIYADLTETDVNRICDAVTDIIYEVQYYEKFGNAALGECEQIDISNEFRYLPCAE
jgi:dTDP-4-amino-4,6-dideoxygalactose transaminase